MTTISETAGGLGREPRSRLWALLRGVSGRETCSNDDGAVREVAGHPPRPDPETERDVWFAIGRGCGEL